MASKSYRDSFRDAFFGISYLNRCLNRGYYPKRYKWSHAWETIACNMGDKVRKHWENKA